MKQMDANPAKPDSRLKILWQKMLRFALTSGIATIVDFLLFLVFVAMTWVPVIANVASVAIGMCINFALQYFFVFDLERKLSKTFMLAVLVSIGGMALSTSIIYGLNHIDFFEARQYLSKAAATGLVFFYSFFFKRLAFEKRFV